MSLLGFVEQEKNVAWKA